MPSAGADLAGVCPDDEQGKNLPNVFVVCFAMLFQFVVGI